VAAEYDSYDTSDNHYDGSSFSCLTANCPISAGDFTVVAEVGTDAYFVTTVLGLQ
jgi:hypothetical protein